MPSALPSARPVTPAHPVPAWLPLPSPWALAAQAAAPQAGPGLAALARALNLAPAPALAALAALDFGPSRAPLDLPSDTGTPLSRDEVLDYDHCFGVQRRQGAQAPLLAAGLQVAAQRFFALAQAHPALDAASLDQQRQGLAAHAALLARCAGVALDHALGKDSAAEPDPAPTPPEPSAWDTWQGFHWSFFIDVQGLVLSLLRFEAALAGGDEPAAEQELDCAAVLLAASGAAMRLAAAFNPTRYADEVRPAMMPPQVRSDRFSGLMAWDHARLVRLWQHLRPQLAALPAALRPAHQRFVQAYGGMMVAHRGVCAHFAGDDGSSLRSRGDSAAVETLDRLGELRLRTLNPPHPHTGQPRKGNA